MKSLFIAGLCAALVIVAFWLWRMSDHRADRRIGAGLAATQPANPGRFDPVTVADLADPADGTFSLLSGPTRRSTRSPTSR
jgi:hypothetical protein